MIFRRLPVKWERWSDGILHTIPQSQTHHRMFSLFPRLPSQQSYRSENAEKDGKDETVEGGRKFWMISNPSQSLHLSFSQVFFFSSSSVSVCVLLLVRFHRSISFLYFILFFFVGEKGAQEAHLGF